VELPPKAEVSIDRIPTREEMRSIILNSNRKTRALAALLATSGLRIGEAASLRVANVHLLGNKITLIASRTKTKKPRVTFITDETAGLDVTQRKGESGSAHHDPRINLTPFCLTGAEELEETDRMKLGERTELAGRSPYKDLLVDRNVRTSRFAVWGTYGNGSASPRKP
jgi:integrase